MRQVPIPAHLVPEGAELDGSGTAYTDAVRVPLAQPGMPGAPIEVAEVAVPRANQLWQVDPDEAKALAARGWRLWLRLAVTPVGVLVTLEPVDAPAPAWGPLNSELP